MAMSDVCLREGTSYEKAILCQTTFQSARVPQGLFIFSLAISEAVGFQTPEKKKQHRVLIDRSIAMKTAASIVP